jgi:DNA invertase Pin-like site-specific DNA recombinase
MKKAIPYYRVSTERQGQSGLGLEAQQKAVHDYAAAFNLDLSTEFIEVESGRKNDRPVLKQALKKCKKENAVLLVAKLDRLGRSVFFISSLIEMNVEFLAIDNPHANNFFLHIMAAFAQYERELASARTKSALAIAKGNGIELGKNGKYILSIKNRMAADEFALKMQPIITDIIREGHKSFRLITERLNAKKIKTYSGGKAKWHLHSVYALIKRIETLKINTSL